MNKRMIKAITLLALPLSLSLSVFADTAITNVSIDTIKQTMTPEQIRQSLDNWKANEMTQIEAKAQAISDRAPIEARRELAKAQIEQEYSRTSKALGL